MHIVFMAWIYVVLMMSLTETSITAGIITFLAYCVLPLAIIRYITTSKQRTHQRKLKLEKSKNCKPST